MKTNTIRSREIDLNIVCRKMVIQVSDSAKLKNRDNFGSGWVDAGLTWEKIGKSSQNSPTLALTSWGSIPSVFSMLLQVVSHYDLSVLSISVMGYRFQKKFV